MEVVGRRQLISLRTLKEAGEVDLHVVIAFRGLDPRLAFFLPGVDVDDGEQGLRDDVEQVGPFLRLGQLHDQPERGKLHTRFAVQIREVLRCGDERHPPRQHWQHIFGKVLAGEERREAGLELVELGQQLGFEQFFASLVPRDEIARERDRTETPRYVGNERQQRLVGVDQHRAVSLIDIARLARDGRLQREPVVAQVERRADIRAAVRQLD